jgi:hypothetical protein
MDAKEFAQELREVVADLKTKGIDSIGADNLIRYLDEAARDLSTSGARPSEATIERYKAELHKWVEEHKNIHTQRVEMFRSVIQAGQNALRTAFLMNGGASVALLAFIGHLSSVAPGRIPSLAPSLAVFVCGVLVAALATGVTYLSQWFYAGDPSWQKKTGFALNIATILLGLSAYGIFAFGMWRAYRVFEGFGL